MIAPADQAVYDPRTLGELEEIFGADRLLDLLGRLKVEIGQRLLASPSERGVLGHDAHTLLSVSGSLGFHDLSKRCSEMEQACLGGADLTAPLESARRAAARAISAIGVIEAGA
ncbi:Hpt domain-containing protein [Methylobacterium sp. J-068]|uniref:Hpt domain-containing protein n=1 Tax=Methylobacterium sp. J-068 TaxID=2836649 RepID=UPI001FB989B4|nr:Hpt domain-containing protein [Methylobacterium sp. J-068]MCJ2033635.1 Hpt domain-containing protein [Methylobacterium sp. J-068]